MTCVVQVTDVAEAELEAAFLWMIERSPERAATWYDGLLTAIESLREMPERWPIVREGTQSRSEIRQLLYGNRRSAYRILFNIIRSEQSNEATTVRVLHVRHAATESLF